jgi:hypothetical protein
MDDRLTQNPLRLSSRCRLTLKGRLHTDPALKARAGPEVERGLQLNETARFVIERCDGAHSIHDLAQALADTWGVPEARAVHDVIAFLESLRQHDYVQVEELADVPSEA